MLSCCVICKTLLHVERLAECFLDWARSFFGQRDAQRLVYVFHRGARCERMHDFGLALMVGQEAVEDTITPGLGCLFLAQGRRAV